MSCMRAFVLAVLAIASASAEDTCFGVAPKYDDQCATIKSQDDCDVQIACLWGDKTKEQCYAKDATNPIMKAACATASSEETCEAQIACEWRSESDLAEWIKSVSSSVADLNIAQPSIPSTISVTMGSTSTSHAHQSCDVSRLDATLSAWTTKYALPHQVSEALRGLVAVEDARFKYNHKVVADGDASMFEVAAAGKNYNGQVSLAFVYGTARISLVKHPLQVSCSEHACFPSFHNSSCHCLIDGVEEDTACLPDDQLRCSDDDARQKPSQRSLNPAETSTVLGYMQSSIFDGIEAEATLLENELRSGGQVTFALV